MQKADIQTFNFKKFVKGKLENSYFVFFYIYTPSQKTYLTNEN